MKTNITRFLIVLLFTSMSSALLAQSIGMNSSGQTPSSNSVLDLNTGNTHFYQGLLLPHVELGSFLSTFSLFGSATNKDTGMIIYNSISSRQPIGCYYWNGSTWVSISGSGNWLLTGNSNTTVGANFLGTTDANALEFKVDAQKAGWIDYATPYNTTFGWEAGNGLTSTSTLNTAVGLDALYSNTKQSGNTAMGDSALYTQSYSTTFNSGNVAIGNSTLYANQPTTTGNGVANTAIGEWAMRYNTTGYENSAIGFQALYENTSGTFNTASGEQALYSNTTGGDNTATGSVALYKNSTGTGNTATGEDALGGCTTGSNNTATGAGAGSSSTSAYYNTSNGYEALEHANTGSSNTAIGTSALFRSTTGSWNTAVGDSALSTNQAGTENTALGYRADVAANNLTNATSIGFQATVGSSNTMQLGNSSVVAIASSGNSIIYNPTLVAINSTATATGAQIVSGYITSTSGAATTITLPTASNLASQIAGSSTAVARGTSLCFTVDNTAGSNTVTVAVNTGITVLGTITITGEATLTVASGNLGVFKIVYITATTAKLIRVS